MNFDDSYQLLDLLDSDSERDTYTARESATGREVFIHLLSKNSGQVPSLLTIAERRLASQADALELQLKIGTFQNKKCLITKSAAELRNIRRALEPAAAHDPFEKAHMWRVPVVNESVPETPEGPPAGEFTRMFEASKTVWTPAAPATPAFERPPSPAQPPTASSSGDGIFTQMFSAPPSKSGPGEFTRMFKGDSTTLSGASKPEVPSPTTSKSGPGDFTRMFKPDASPEPAAKENWLDFAERPQQSSSLDSINWDSPQTQGATGAFAVRSAPAPDPALEQGSSDFTRLISAPSSLPKQVENPAVSSEPQPPAQSQPSTQSMSNLPIIIALNVLLITAVALILYFVLRR